MPTTCANTKFGLLATLQFRSQPVPRWHPGQNGTNHGQGEVTHATHITKPTPELVPDGHHAPPAADLHHKQIMPPGIHNK